MPGRRAPEEERREQILAAAERVALHTGIDGVTLRAVASAARLSHGLVLFHFKRKDQLIAALLDRVLATTAMAELADELARHARDPHRLAAVLTEQLDQLLDERKGVRLFFEYWALGVRHAPIRRRVAAALERYRAAFRTLAEELLPAGTLRSHDEEPDALAAVALSLVIGCAVQAMIAPDQFDRRAYLDAVRDLTVRVVPGSARGRRARA